ncbi:MAG: hypothetical protein VYE50_02380 [Candidatus Thermoplasmatota archaeon]|nr:hypothetical protein [Candidatus Thermoplasmatota archaeon]
MSKVYLFAVMLLAASFTGCIEGGDLEESTTTEEEEEVEEEEETLDPVGVDDNAGKPGVEFVGLFKEYNDSDYVYLVAAMYDTDGYVLSYTIQSDVEVDEENTEGHISGGYDYGCDAGFPLTGPNSNSDFECYPVFNSIIIDVCYEVEPVDQKITITIRDNDGNTASAEYNLVYDDLECDWNEWGGGGSSAPIATMFVQEDSSGVYHVDVIQVTSQEDLTNFSFFLKDASGSTYVGGNGFGEIAMQIMGGEEHGIDIAYDGDDEQLTNRANNVSDDDGTDFPVHFSDNDRDGKLSAGDSFRVYGQGSGANGPASDEWRLDIQYDPTGDIVGSAKLL